MQSCSRLHSFGIPCNRKNMPCYTDGYKMLYLLALPVMLQNMLLPHASLTLFISCDEYYLVISAPGHDDMACLAILESYYMYGITKPSDAVSCGHLQRCLGHHFNSCGLGPQDSISQVWSRTEFILLGLLARAAFSVGNVIVVGAFSWVA